MYTKAILKYMLTAPVAAALLIGCGGGGGGGGGGSNNAPVADAGTDQNVLQSAVVQLDGGGSSDADGDSLTYQWTITGKPAGSSVALSSNTVVNPTLVVDRAGTYTIELAVNDGEADSAADAVTVTVTNQTGTPDTSFSGDGIVIDHNAAGGGGNDMGSHIVSDSDGYIYVTGSSNNGTDLDMVIWKYRPDGTLDTTFGAGGIVVHDNAAGGAAGNDAGANLVLDGMGNIYVTGASNNGSDNDMVIWKYRPDGTLDNSFDGDGIAVSDNAAGGAAGDDAGYDIVLDGDGNIYVTGYSYNGVNLDMVVWKYRPNGTLDTAFGTNGTVVYNSTGIDGGLAIVLGGNGDIYVTGMSSSGANRDMSIWKYDLTGTPDATFGTGGIVIDDNASGGSGEDGGYDLVLDGDGNVYVTGYSNNGSNEDMVIWKYDPTGTPDSSFGGDGIVTQGNAAGGDSVDGGWGILLDAAGNIYVSGVSRNSSNQDMVIWKYDPTGTLYSTFGAGGIIVDDNAAGGAAGYDHGWGIMQDRGGYIFVTGWSNNGSNDDMVIWKYK